ncbi:hypothetical protein OC842_002464 [Tilletia horrida]|uniref:Uncharacterized protein n=1 Tax=Tilletia horrida TaxID=155126 RepID=A0AAN6GHX8_9BASI|nr:hypothetical protein OC842_002464 [Tilletia horrida]
MDERDDSDASSITSDLDAPTSVTLFCIDDEHLLWPDPAPIRSQVQKLRLAINKHDQLILGGIDAVKSFAGCAFRHKYLQHEATALCARVLAFFQEVVDAGFTSAASGTLSPIMPGTVASFVLNEIITEVNNISDTLWGYVGRLGRNKLKPHERPQVRTSLAMGLIRIKQTLRDSKLCLGLLSKAHRIAFKDSLSPHRHPFSYPALQRLFYAYMGRLYEESQIWTESRTAFPKGRFFSQLFGFLRELNVEHEGTSGVTGLSALAKEASESGHEDAAAEDGDTELAGVAIGGTGNDGHELNPDKYIAILHEELDPRQMAFSNSGQIEAWRETTVHITAAAWDLLNRDRDILHKRNGHHLLALLLIETCKTENFEIAANLAELLAVHYRFSLTVNPQPANRLKLCMALGALATVHSQDLDRKVAAIHAVEEARRAFSSLEQHLSIFKFRAISGRLHLAYALALVGKHKSPSGYEVRALCVARKALRSSVAATVDLRAALEHSGGDELLRATLGHAFEAGAEIGLLLLHELHGQQIVHSRCGSRLKSSPAQRQLRLRDADAFDWSPMPRAHCVEANSVLERAYIHAKMDDYSLGTLKDFAKMIQEAIAIFVDLSMANLRMHVPALTAALEFQACLVDRWPAQAVDAYRGVILMYERMAPDFPNFHSAKLGSSYRELAGILRSQGEVFETCVVLGNALRHGENVDCWRGRQGAPAVHAARALSFAQMEQYDDALQEAANAQNTINAELSLTHPEDEALEGRTVKAFALWMKGEPELGIQELQAVMGRSMAREEEERRHVRAYRREDDPTWLLCLAWMGAMKSAAGGVEAAKRGGEDGRLAIEHLRKLFRLKYHLINPAPQSDDRNAELKLKAIRALDRDALMPLEVLYPHALVLYAGSLVQLGARPESTRVLGLALLMYAAFPSARRDGSSLKTALEMRDQMFSDGEQVSVDGWGEELQADSRFPALLEGEGLAVDPAFSGFFKHMGCGKEPPTIHGIGDASRIVPE